MERKKMFSKGVFKETLREIKNIGIIFTAIGLVSVLGVFSIRLLSYIDSGNLRHFTMSNSMEVTFYGLVLVYIGAFLASLKVYGYVNTRKTADFYHSLPYTRECIYLSKTAAVVAMLAVIMLLTTAVGTSAYFVTSLAVGTTLLIPYTSILLDLIPLAAMLLLMVAIVGVAVSVTGNRFMNIVVSLLIIFVPRLFINSFVSIVVAKAPILVMNSFGFILSYKVNLICTGYMPLLGNNLYQGILPVIYTASLAVLYGVLACFLFKKRKSEAAHCASATPVLQSLFRIIIAVFLCVWSFIFIAEYGFEPAWIVWYAIVAVIYFVFELITTKKLKNLLRAIPGLFISAGILVVTFFGAKGVAAIALSYEPSANEIKCVRILSESDYYDNDNIITSSLLGYYNIYDGQYSYGKWAFERFSEVSVYDDKVSEIISNALASCNKDCKNGEFEKYGEYKYLTVAVTTEKGTKERYIRITSDNYDKIIDAFSENEHYRRNYLELPDAKSVEANGLEIESVQIPNDVYEVFKEEISKVDFSDWYDYVSSSDYYSNPDITLEVTIDNGGLNLETVRIPLKKKYAPKTYEEVLSKYLYSKERAEKLLSDVETLYNHLSNVTFDEIESNYMEMYVNIFVYDEESEEYIPYSLDAEYSAKEKSETDFEESAEAGYDDDFLSYYGDIPETAEIEKFNYTDFNDIIPNLKKTLNSEISSEKFITVYYFSNTDIMTEYATAVFSLSDEVFDFFINAAMSEDLYRM